MKSAPTLASKSAASPSPMTFISPKRCRRRAVEKSCAGTDRRGSYRSLPTTTHFTHRETTKYNQTVHSSTPCEVSFQLLAMAGGLAWGNSPTALLAVAQTQQ